LILLTAAAIWFLGPPALWFAVGIATDKYYHFREVCGPSEGCVTIVYESKLSLNSYVKKYFFIGSWFNHPVMNDDYVMFEDGAEFCFIDTAEGRYKIYANMQPAVNNLVPYVEIHPLNEAAGHCRSF
jgi:hypothetical protein